jgi:hypothetical protein
MTGAASRKAINQTLCVSSIGMVSIPLTSRQDEGQGFALTNAACAHRQHHTVKGCNRSPCLPIPSSPARRSHAR